jgi:hypothetical protein
MITGDQAQKTFLENNSDLLNDLNSSIVSALNSRMPYCIYNCKSYVELSKVIKILEIHNYTFEGINNTIGRPKSLLGECKIKINFQKRITLPLSPLY